MDKGSRIGSIITKKNGMFVSADNNGNIREAGVGNPITECSFIAAPNSIINSINGTYYTPLSNYISDSIDYSISYLLTYFITPIHDIIDPEPEMSIDNRDSKNQLTLNIINYSNEISLNIINIKGNIKYSDIKWYIKYNIKETDNIQDIIDNTYNDNNNLDLPCRLKYTEGYNNEVIYNKQYFDDIILVYAKASITRLDGKEAKCSAHVLLKCDTDTEFAKNAVYTFYKKAESNIPESLSTDNNDSTTTLSGSSSESTSATPSVIPIMPTLLPNYQYLSYESYIYPNSYKGSIDLYTRSYPYSFDNLTITYNDNVNNIEVYSVINGTYTNIKNGGKVYNNDVTDMIYSYNPNGGADYTYQKINSDFKNKICISYCSYSRFKPASESDSNFINRIQIDSTWGSNPNLKNNSYSTNFYICGNEIKKRPADTNGLSITCNYELDYKKETNTYIIYIPYSTDLTHPETIEFTLNKDFGYNYDDEYYFGTGLTTPYPGANQVVEYAKNFGWVIYPSINIGFNETTNNNNYFNKPRVYGFDNNNEYNGGDFIRTTPNDDSNISSKTNILYYFNYQHDNNGSISKAPIFKDNHNKLGIDIYGLPLPLDGNNNNSYLPLTILFTTNIDNYGDKINSSEIYEVLNVYIYKNPTPPPTKQPIYT